MTRYLHTMDRITDPEQSRVFYEALGLELRRDMDIVRDGEREATNYFFGVPGQEEELELTFNHDGRTYDLGTGYGHIARGRRPRHDPRGAVRAGHRARTPALRRPRGRVAALFRPRPG
jgi:catechol 2,3-dioxygenase-like lactoylglutathione lyase family enzyme